MGKSKNMIGMSHNCSNEKDSVLSLVERAKLEWELTADALPQLICILDKNGNILRANRTIEDWGIGKLKNIRGQELHETLHSYCRDSKCYLKNKWSEIRDKMIEEEPFGFDIFDIFLKKHILAHFYPVPKRLRGRREIDSFAVMIMQDFTDIKNTESRLLESYKYIGSINRRLDTLLKINKLLLDKEKKIIFRNINGFAMDLLQSQANLIYKFKKNKKCFQLLAASSLPHGHKHKIFEFPEKISKIVELLRRNRAICLVEKNEKGMDKFEMNGEFQQFIFIPLMSGRELSGVMISLFSNSKKISEEDMLFYEMFSYKLSFFLLQRNII